MSGGLTRTPTLDASFPDSSLPLGACHASDADYTLTDAAMVVMQCDQGRNLKLTTTAGVGATRQLGAPIKPKKGWYFLEIDSHNAAGVDITFTSDYVFSQGIAVHLSGVANCKDLLTMYYNGSKMVVSLGAANFS